jgi:hypothetical protein
MGMSWPWPSSEQTDKVVPAFVLALQAVEDVTRSKTVNAGNMRYAYADLDAVLEAAKPVLTVNGLAVTQAAAQDGITALLMHASGQWLSFPPLQVTTQQNTPQGQGSALTYARRYQMLALLNIATEDDDGKSASKPRKAAAPKATDDDPNKYQGPNEAVFRGDAPSDAQRAKAMAMCKELGITDRTNRNTYFSAWVGRDVGSFNDLTRKEAGLVIDQLEQMQTVPA